MKRRNPWLKAILIWGLLGQPPGPSAAFADTFLQRCASAFGSLWWKPTPEMTTDEFAQWLPNVAVSPKQSLDLLLTKKIPLAKHGEAANALFPAVLQEVEKKYDEGEKREASELYQQFLKAISKMQLSDDELKRLAESNFTSRSLEKQLSKFGLTGKEKKDKTLLHAVQRNLYHALRRQGESGLSVWWLHPDNRKLVDSLSVLTLLLAVSGGASVAIPQLVQSHPEEYYKLAADFSGSVYTIEGSKFLGFGLYFKMSDVEKTLGRPFQERLQALSMARSEGDPGKIEKAEDQVISYLVDEIHGDFDHDTYPVKKKPKHAAIPAEKILRSSGCESRGVCRHKALLLSAILNEIGIPSAYETGILAQGTHAWVILKKRDVVVDPTLSLITTKEDYYGRSPIVSRSSIDHPDTTKMLSNEY